MNLNKMFFRKSVLIMLNLRLDFKDETISSLRKKTDIAYAWISRQINELQNAGLIQIEKRGRRKIIRLTEKGKEIADELNILFNKLGG